MPRDEHVLALRRELASAIVRALQSDGGTGDVVAQSFGISQPRLSELVHGHVESCSLERLIRCVDRLGGTVTLSVDLPDVAVVWTRERFRELRRKRPAPPPAR